MNRRFVSFAATGQLSALAAADIDSAASKRGPSATDRMRKMLAAAACLALALVASGAAPAPAAECRGKGSGFKRHRQALFGDLHVHSKYSTDAYVFDVFEGPREAYAFARGTEIGLPPYDGGVATRRLKIDRPLQFTAVTDHSEGFGFTHKCTDALNDENSDTLIWQSFSCRMARGEIIGPAVPLGAFVKLLYLLPNVIFVPPVVYPECTLLEDAEGCEPNRAGAPIWQDIRAAAEEANDPCEFTTFQAWEYTATPYFFNQHRNIIFRGQAPDEVISYLETGSSDEDVLLQRLDALMNDPDHDYDLVSIPHNSNLSGGFMFPDPKNDEEAARRARIEPLIEIMQHKGQSECRWDRRFGSGVDTTDELCSFEQPVSVNLSFATPAPPPQAFPRRSYVRNLLKDGLVLRGKYNDPDGNPLNPYKMGIIASTDTHNATPGATSERSFEGHSGLNDNVQRNRVGNPALIQWNPGGLAVVWAHENTRDSIFAALQRKETYGTSGTRPEVRFFGGFGLQGTGEDLCNGDPGHPVETADDRGVPMGGDLGSPDGSPQFLVWAKRDATSAPLQRIQIIKGWVDAAGKAHETIYPVAGDEDNGAWVNEDDCSPTGPGFTDLCKVWTDPNFDASQNAFYYARVLENPTCRWSTRQCMQLGVNPFDVQCAAQAASAAPTSYPTELCCSHEPLFEKVIQERAWTSPIWYSPPAPS